MVSERREQGAASASARCGVNCGGAASLAAAQSGSHGQQLAMIGDKREGRESKRRQEAALAKATRSGARKGKEIERWRRAWCRRAEFI
ncbi:hypothetical protein U1Q18_039257 [Sarracenia purpurea var. burkii]